ncbi:MAG: hypothetical protein A2143_08080 [Gallionellales bacterium RBG_16_57_15]|nr:MAG: hypothetical protein A2143_08080 [Gallionellales bacterium RBG_16_57_15]
MNDPKFKANADTINAPVNGMGALVFALVRQLSPEQQKAFQKDLMALSNARNKIGDTTAGTLILDLASSAEIAARPN